MFSESIIYWLELGTFKKAQEQELIPQFKYGMLVIKLNLLIFTMHGGLVLGSFLSVFQQSNLKISFKYGSFAMLRLGLVNARVVFLIRGFCCGVCCRYHDVSCTVQ